MTGEHRTEKFVRLLLDNQRRIYGLIAAMVPNPADADDVFQEVSASLWRKFDEFQPGTDFAAWASKFARFTALKHFRQGVRRRLQFDSDLLDQIAEEAEALAPDADARFDALQECLSQLNSRSRLLVQRRYEPGATVKDIAVRAGRTANAVYKELSIIHSNLLVCVRRRLAAMRIA